MKQWNQIDFHHDVCAVRSALEGDQAAAEAICATAQKVTSILKNEWRGDCSTASKIPEIVADLLADCFGSTQRQQRESRLLELYGGRSSLLTWLLVCARSRVSNWRRSLRTRLTTSLTLLEEAGGETAASEEILRPDAEEVVNQLFTMALRDAFEAMATEQVVLIRLVYLHGIARERLAVLWDIHPSNIGRRVSDGLGRLRSRTLIHLKAMDPFLDLNWNDCLEICARYPRLVHGDFETLEIPVVAD